MSHEYFETAVAFAVCGECGAAVVLDPRDTIDRRQQHHEWHIRASVPPPDGGVPEPLPDEQSYADIDQAFRDRIATLEQEVARLTRENASLSGKLRATFKAWDEEKEFVAEVQHAMRRDYEYDDLHDMYKRGLTVDQACDELEAARIDYAMELAADRRAR